MSRSRLENQKCILTWKKTLDEGAFAFRKTVKRSDKTFCWFVDDRCWISRTKLHYKFIKEYFWPNPIQSNFFTKKLDPIQSNPTQSNPIHGWIQSMSNSGFKSGLFGGQHCGSMKLIFSLCKKLTVLAAVCEGAPSCCSTQLCRPHTSRMSRSKLPGQ